MIAYLLQLGFNDVLAEPDTAQGFDGMWKLAYVVFTQTMLWLFRLVGLNTTYIRFHRPSDPLRSVTTKPKRY